MGQGSDRSFEEFFAASYGRLVGLLYVPARPGPGRGRRPRTPSRARWCAGRSSAATTTPRRGADGGLPPGHRPSPPHRPAAAGPARLGPPPSLPPVDAEHLDLVRALGKLPLAQREVLVLHYVAELAVDRVAAELRLPVGTVKSRLARGRAALAWLQPGVGTPDGEAPMREEELRSRLQAAAVAGRAAPAPSAFRSRPPPRPPPPGRDRAGPGGTLVVAVGGVRLATEAADRPSVLLVAPVAPPSGPPAAVAPVSFVGQVGDGSSRRTVIIDASTGESGVRYPAPTGRRTTSRTRWSARPPQPVPPRPPAPARPRPATAAGPRSTWPPGPAARLRGADRGRGVQPERRRPDPGLLHTSAPSAMDRTQFRAAPSWSCEAGQRPPAGVDDPRADRCRASS